MNIQRFSGATAREALAKARLTFGDDTLILSNRTTPTGVEVVATTQETLAVLDHNHSVASVRQAPSPTVAPTLASATHDVTASTVNVTPAQDPVTDDATQLAMSTLSFQDYVRERMLRRRQAAIGEQAATALPAPVAAPQRSTAAPAKSLPAVKAAPTAELSQGIVDELRAMKALMEDRFNTLAWLGQARQNPIQSNLMLKLIRAGYSPTLSRTVLERMPEEMDAAESVRWVMDILEHNLKTDAAAQPLQEEGGTFALVGATGVGKTTTAAKLAGLCVRAHGSDSVGLITLDTYRIGAHEQLRAYGRMLGVVAHLAHDRAALQDLLKLLGNKKLILIDTIGLAPNDPRKRSMLDVLDLPGVNRLLVLNAGGHGDTLDEVVSSFKSSGVQQAVLSKIDEAAKLAPALDAAIRHRLVLRGVTMGQKVPEDWELADAAKLVRLSMRAPVKSAFDPKAQELGFFFSQPNPSQLGQLDA
jgi:flagellar biosynthesis protein FlhF